MMALGPIVILCVCAFVCVSALIQVWIGFVGYAGFALLAPQYTWKEALGESELQKFISAATVIGFVLTGLRSQRLPKAVKWTMLCYTAYIGLVFLGSGIDVNPEKTARFVDISWKIWLMSMIGIMVIDSEKKLAILMGVLLACTAWPAWELNMRYLRQGFIRVNEFFFAGLDNNLYSISTLPIACITLAFLLLSKSLLWQGAASFVLALQMHQIMILQSRGTMLGMLASGGIAVYFMPKNPRTIALVALAVLGGSILAGPSVIEEFATIFQSREQLDNSASSRYKVWTAGAKIMIDYPITGVGPWCGEVYVPRYYEGYAERRNYKALHNLFFEVGTGFGVPGVTIYLAIFAIPWFMNLRLWMHHRGGMSPTLLAGNLAVLAGIPGYWLASMFSSGALIESPYLMVVIACATGAICTRHIESEGAMFDSEAEDEDGEDGESSGEDDGEDDDGEFHGEDDHELEDRHVEELDGTVVSVKDQGVNPAKRREVVSG
jgi:O-antigen ligase